MKKFQIKRNLGNLGNLRNIIASFLISEFSNLSYIKNRKLGFKKLMRFPSFRVFDLVRNDRVIAAQSRYMRIQTNNLK